MGRWIVAYTTKLINGAELTSDMIVFIYRAGKEMNAAYGNKYDFAGFPIRDFVARDKLWVCFRDQEIVGFMAASLGSSFFDPKVKILRQHVLYGKPGTRAAHYLLKSFIDFGKANAKHLISVIGSETNIKPRSLERLGFKELETLYRMET